MMKRAPAPFMRALACLLLAGVLACIAGLAHSAPAAYFPAGHASYFPFQIDANTLSGAVDQSALNRPLDASSRVFVRDGHFYRVGADGKPDTADDQRVRLFGVNLTFGADFPDDQQALQLAKRLRQLGFNAVRLHHLDSLPSDNTDAPYSILTTGPFPTFNNTAVTRLRGLIDALASQGIYVDLNLHVGYRFRPVVDGLPMLDGDTELKVTNPIHEYYPELIAQQETYARKLIALLGLAHNPALAMVEINNESSLVYAWLGPDWHDAVPSAYAPALQRQWRTWLQAHYTGLQAACDAWGGCPDGADNADELPAPDETPTYDTAQSELFASLARHLQSFWHDSSAAKVPQRTLDFLQFLSSVDQAYFDRLRQVVHDSTDPLVPMTGTQMGFGGLLNFDANQSMDYLDDHIYVAHPDISGSATAMNWRVPLITTSGKEFYRIQALAWRRERGKPFVVSEFGQPFPNPRGAEMLPLISAVAAQQDWDGLFYFDYSDAVDAPLAPSRFSLSGDWGPMALVGASAQLFRRHLVAPLARHIDIPLSAKQRLALGADRRFEAITPSLQEALNIQPQLAFLGQVAVQTHPEAKPDMTGLTGHGSVNQSSDGVLQQNVKAGRIMIDGARLWALFGTTGTSALHGHSVWMQFADKGPGSASAMLTALDAQPLAQSRHLLLSLGNFTTGSLPGSSPPQPNTLVYSDDKRWLTLAHNPGNEATQPPTWLLSTPATLGLGPRPGSPTVYPLDGTGRRMAPLPAADVSVDAQGARIQVQTGTASDSPWYEIVYPEPR